MSTVYCLRRTVLVSYTRARCGVCSLGPHDTQANGAQGTRQTRDKAIGRVIARMGAAAVRYDTLRYGLRCYLRCASAVLGESWCACTVLVCVLCCAVVEKGRLGEVRWTGTGGGEGRGVDWLGGCVGGGVPDAGGRERDKRGWGVLVVLVVGVLVAWVGAWEGGRACGLGGSGC